MTDTYKKLKLSTEHRKKFIDNFWLGLGDVNNIKTGNVIATSKYFKENPSLAVIDIMRKPENFAYTCEVLLNCRIAQYQALILKTMWVHPFPMLIGSRGMSKCITKDSIVMSNGGIQRISDFIDETYIEKQQYKVDIKLLGENGFKDVDYCWYNGVSDTLKITTSQGFELEGTSNHPVRILSENSVEWKNIGDLEQEDYIIIDRTETWFEDIKNEIQVDEAYLLGLLVGDGGYTVRGRISFTNIDEELTDAASKFVFKYFGKEFSKKKNGISSILYSVEIWERLFSYYGFKSSVCGDKDVPNCILKGSKDCAKAFIQGLFDADGTVMAINHIGYCAKSEKIVRMIQFILTKFGIVSKISPRLNKQYNKIYFNLTILGNNARLFAKKIGFRLKRKQDKLLLGSNKLVNCNLDIIPSRYISERILRLKYKYLSTKNREWHSKRKFFTKWYLDNYDITYDKFEKILLILNEEGASSDEDYIYLRDVFNKHYFFDKISKIETSTNHTFDFYIPNDHSFISNGFISHNSFSLAIYALLRAIFIPGSKIVITGAAFRQAKIIFNYIETIWQNAKMLQDILSDKNNRPMHSTDEYFFKLGDSSIIAIPTGTGESIRGKRSSCLLVDEFNSINVQVFEEIMQGFGAVSLNPIEAMIDYSKLQAYKTLGDITQEQLEEEQSKVVSNQTIISGTCGYTFEHLYRYWRDYKDIITNNSQKEKLGKMFGEAASGISAKDFCIIRFPYDLIPKGVMNDKTIAKAKATSNSSIFNSEFGAVFLSDTQGFFRRSLIENCVCGKKPDAPITKQCGIVDFTILMEGSTKFKYVMGIDPAAESDNFAIVILEVWGDHRRIIYSWTTNNENHKLKLKHGLVDEHNYYIYCGRKIRDLMRLFNIEFIAMDAQGGGKSVAEVLGDPKYLKDREQVIYPVQDLKKPKSTDHLLGLHMLHLIEFSNAEWVYAANHGLKQDMETREICFPSCDSISFGLLHEQDKLSRRVTDKNDEFEHLRETAEDVLLEIEELKNELVLIEHTKTPAGRDRWDTPQVKGLGTKKGRLHKDRYSALLMANAVGREMITRTVEYEYNAWGGFAKDIAKKEGKLKQEELPDIDSGFSFGGGVRRR